MAQTRLREEDREDGGMPSPAAFAKPQLAYKGSITLPILTL